MSFMSNPRKLGSTNLSYCTVVSMHVRSSSKFASRFYLHVFVEGSYILKRPQFCHLFVKFIITLPNMWTTL